MQQPPPQQAETDRILDAVQQLYDAGRYLDAHREAGALGDYRGWRGTRARVLAGRLAYRLGAPRLGMALHFKAFREDRSCPEALYYYAIGCIGRQSPLSVLEFLGRKPFTGEGPQRAHLHSLKAHMLARLRDFERAHAELDHAQSLSPQDAWLLTTRSYLFEAEDRLQDAMAAARAALEARPLFHPAVLQYGDLLAETDRLQEALDYLDQARPKLQSATAYQLQAHLCSEAADHGRAYELFDESEAYAPIMEPAARSWLHARRAQSAYLSGDRKRAIEHATKAGAQKKHVEGSYFHHMSKLPITATANGRRQLSMGFERQHHLTCGPASLASIARYWEQPVDQAELAREICYGGTQNHGERDWAERSGYRVREFTVTAEAARALIDRGIPFALTTLETTSGHLQVVYGYDRELNTLLVRDPSRRHFAEYDLEPLLERYASVGPRGMVMVPEAQAQRLQGLSLPDAVLHDHLHSLQRALSGHDRQRAEGCLLALRANHGDHRIAVEAELALARYDEDAARQLDCLDRLLELYPKDARTAYCRAAVLRNLQHHAQWMAFVQEWASSPELGEHAFYSALAEDLRHDGRRRREAHHYLRKAIRQQPDSALYHHQLADLVHGEGDTERAIELYRLASCLDEINEHFAIEYFRAARLLKQAPRALDFLHKRVERLGQRSGAAACTLFEAYEELSREREGFQVLERALATRSEEGPLLLFAAEAHARYGRFEQADGMLEQAEPHSHRIQWLSAQARIESYRLQPRDTTDWWREIVEARPFELWAHSALVDALRAKQGPEAAIEHLKAACARFPNHRGLLRLLAQTLVAEGRPDAEDALRAMVEVSPADAYARRELGFYLLGRGAHEAARAELQHAMELDDQAAAAHGFAGLLALETGDAAAARAHLRRALELDVDYGWGIDRLMRASETIEEKRESLAFVRAQLESQTTYGQGLREYRVQARAHLSDAETMVVLQAALDTRPDLPQAWSTLAQELVAQNLLDRARALLDQALERFATSEMLWLVQAEVCELLGDREARESALRSAMAVAPSSTDAGRVLVNALTEWERFDEAVALGRHLVAKGPLLAANHGTLGEALFKRGAKKQALQCLRHAVELDPSYSWGIRALRRFALEQDLDDPTPEILEGLAARRPGDPAIWMMLARVRADDDPSGSLDALARAIELEPRLDEAHDLRAVLLVDQKRFAEAIAATDPEGWAGPLPANLRGRRHWIEAERGELEVAIAGMRKLVTDHPDYEWGLRHLADWCEQLGDVEGNIEASRALLRLSPHAAASHGYLATALLAAERRSEAKASFLRSTELDPGYNYGSIHVFDLCFEDGELDTAERALANIERHLQNPDPDLEARKVLLALKRDDHARARDAFAAMLHCTRCDRDMQRRVYTALIEAGLEKDARALLEEVLVDPKAEPGAGMLWSDRSLPQRRYKSDLRRALGRELGPAGIEMVAELIENAGEAGEVHSYRLWLLMGRATIRKHARIWGAVGFALVRHSAGAAVRFMRGWRGYPDIRPWMLNNLALAYEHLGRFRLSDQVRQAALALEADHTERYHIPWGALGAALCGDNARSRTIVERVERTDPDDDGKHALQLTRLILSVDDSQCPPREALRKVAAFERDLIVGNQLSARLQHACNQARRTIRSHMSLWQILLSHLD
ncbi:MAG: C39 family peptidase [Myxococcales bacterium]|nr:C39 family peptidase [Myxococcales bacterium]